MINNDYLIGRKAIDFSTKQIHGKKIQKIFEQYTGKKMSVDILRASQSTCLDTQLLSLAQCKQIAQNMGHQLSTHLQYSKKMLVSND